MVDNKVKALGVDRHGKHFDVYIYRSVRRLECYHHGLFKDTFMLNGKHVIYADEETFDDGTYITIGCKTEGMEKCRLYLRLQKINGFYHYVDYPELE